MTSAVADLPPLSADWLRRGQLALRWGRRAEARRCLQSAVAADPRNAMAWILLARLSAPRARLAYLARALELNPAHALAHEELRRARRAMEAPPLARRVPESAPRRQFSAWLWLTLFSIFGVFGAMAVAPGLWPPRPAAPANVVFNGLIKAPFTASPTHSAIPSATPTATFTSTPTATVTPTPTETATPLPTATPSVPLPESVKSDERWIDVDLSEQTLSAYEGTTLLQTFIVSTGVWEHPTVTGQFHIYVKYPAADMAGPGYYLPAVPYVMYFYQDYGLHGTYWHSNFGTPMSHGCVNLRTEDAAWLFDWASVGTVVNVHD